VVPRLRRRLPTRASAHLGPDVSVHLLLAWDTFLLLYVASGNPGIDAAVPIPRAESERSKSPECFAQLSCYLPHLPSYTHEIRPPLFDLIRPRRPDDLNPKNTICLWFNKDAHDAARFYAATFPNSKVTSVHKAPADYPGGKKGDELTVEFTVLGIPCLGLMVARRQAQRGLFFPDRDGQSGRDRPLLERDRRQWRPGKCVRLVQGPLGHLLANHATRSNRRPAAGGTEAKRTFEAMMPMKKIDIATIEAARRG